MMPLWLGLIACVPPLATPGGALRPMDTASTDTGMAEGPAGLTRWARFVAIGSEEGGLGMAMSGYAAEGYALAIGSPGTDEGGVPEIHFLPSSELHPEEPRGTLALEPTSEGAAPAARAGAYFTEVLDHAIAAGSSSEDVVRLLPADGSPALLWTMAVPQNAGLGHAVIPLGSGHIVVGSPGSAEVHVVPFPAVGATTWEEPPAATWTSAGALGRAIAAADFGCPSGEPGLAMGAPDATNEGSRGRVFLVCDPLLGGSVHDAPGALRLDNVFGPTDMGAHLLAAPLTGEAGDALSLVVGHRWGWSIVTGAWLADALVDGGAHDVRDARHLLLSAGGLGDLETFLACHGLAAGDFDGDGTQDLAVGHCDDPDGIDRVFVVLDPLSRPRGSELLVHEAADVVLLGDQTDNYTGASLATLPADDGPGTGPDLLVFGAPEHDLVGDQDQGKVSVVDPCIFREVMDDPDTQIGPWVCDD